MIEIASYSDLSFTPYHNETHYMISLYGKDTEIYTWEIKDQIYAQMMGWA